jgi:hypothetical protein
MLHLGDPAGHADDAACTAAPLMRWVFRGRSPCLLFFRRLMTRRCWWSRPVISAWTNVSWKRWLVCPDGKRLYQADALPAKTGFSIGSVSPLAHAAPSVTAIDVAASF